MRSNRFLFVVFAVLLVAIFAGCSSDRLYEATPLTADQQAIADVVALLSNFDHDVVSHTTPDTTASVSASAASVGTHFWWREYNANTPSVTITVNAADGQNPNAWADVSLSTSFVGVFHVVHRDNAGAFTHTTRAITDVYNQTARFEQTGLSTDPNRGWTLTQTSNIVGGSNPTSLDIGTFSITPAVSNFRTYNASNFGDLSVPGAQFVLETDEQVNILVVSGTGTSRVFRHDFYASGVVRQEMTNVDLGYYADGITTPTALSSFDASRLMVVDVIAPGVIDGSATYEAVIWAVPYRVDLSGAPS